MIFFNNGGLYLSKMEDGKIVRSNQFYSPFQGFLYQSYSSDPPIYSFCASSWGADYPPLKSVIIPTNLSNTTLTGKMCLSKVTGRLYILVGFLGNDARAFVLNCPKKQHEVGSVHELPFDRLDFTPPGFEFELKNPIYDQLMEERENKKKASL